MVQAPYCFCGPRKWAPMWTNPGRFMKWGASLSIFSSSSSSSRRCRRRYHRRLRLMTVTVILVIIIISWVLPPLMKSCNYLSDTHIYIYIYKVRQMTPHYGLLMGGGRTQIMIIGCGGGQPEANLVAALQRLLAVQEMVQEP